MTVTMTMEEFEEMDRKAKLYEALENREFQRIIVHPNQIEQYHDGYKEIKFQLKQLNA